MNKDNECGKYRITGPFVTFHGGVKLRKPILFIPLFLILLFASGCDLLNLSDSDQAALDSLVEAGSDLTKVHPFDFYLYHSERTGVEQLCAALKAQDFQVTVREGAIEGEWLCLARLNFVPSIDKLSELDIQFMELTNQYGGEYDGWETIVIP